MRISVLFFAVIVIIFGSGVVSFAKGKEPQTIPKQFIGIWAETSETAKSANKLTISPDSIVWERVGEDTETIGKKDLTIGNEGESITFKSKVTYAKSSFGRIAYKGDVEVKLTLVNGALLLKIGEMKVNESPSGLMQWTGNTLLTWDEERRGYVVSRKPEEHTYRNEAVGQGTEGLMTPPAIAAEESVSKAVETGQTGQRYPEKPDPAQEVSEPNLKITVLEEKKEEKVPVEGASVYLDGKEIGATDKAGELLTKETIENYHILEVKKLGYFTFKENIEISEYAEDKTVILSPGIASSEGYDNGEDEGVQETQEQVTETPEQESVTPEQDVISERKTEKVHEQQTDKKTEKPILKISVLGDTGMERVPVKGAKILMNGYLCGETDKDGVFTKRERMGEHKLKVEKNGFYPVSQKIEFNEYSDSYEIVLKKKQVKQ